MNPRDLEAVCALRARLHACPELSGHEDVTIDTLQDFLSYKTSLRLERREGETMLISLNPRYAPIRVSEGDELRLFGKVVG